MMKNEHEPSNGQAPEEFRIKVKKRGSGDSSVSSLNNAIPPDKISPLDQTQEMELLKLVRSVKPSKGHRRPTR